MNRIHITNFIYRRYAPIVIACIFICFICISCNQNDTQNITFTPCTPMPEQRAAAAVATYNNMAYIYGGRAQTRSEIKGDFWLYNPENDSWTKLKRPPLKARTGAVAIATDSLIYIGLGFNGQVYNDSSYLRDWWQYNPLTEEWKQLQSYPTNETAAPSAFLHEDYIYIAFGSYDISTNKLYRYNITHNTWSEVNAGSCAKLVETVATSIKGRSFAGTNRYWYEFNHTSCQWERRGDYKKDGNWLSSTLLQHNDYIYILGGREWTATASKSGIIRYNLHSDTWDFIGHLPQEAGKENAIGFTINGIAYYGLGEEMGNTSDKLYKITFN